MLHVWYQCRAYHSGVHWGTDPETLEYACRRLLGSSLKNILWRQGHKIRQRKKLKCNTVAVEALTNSPGSSMGWPFSIDLNWGRGPGLYTLTSTSHCIWPSPREGRWWRWARGLSLAKSNHRGPSWEPPTFPECGRGCASVLKRGSEELSTTSTEWILLTVVTEVPRLMEASKRYMLSRLPL